MKSRFIGKKMKKAQETSQLCEKLILDDYLVCMRNGASFSISCGSTEVHVHQNWSDVRKVFLQWSFLTSFCSSTRMFQ